MHCNMRLGERRNAPALWHHVWDINHQSMAFLIKFICKTVDVNLLHIFFSFAWLALGQLQWVQVINSLVPGRSGCDFKKVTDANILMIGDLPCVQTNIWHQNAV